MKRRIVLAVVLGMVVFGGLSVLAATCVSRTVTTRGEQAVRAMDAEERAAFAQLSLITREMRADQVYQVLGPPSEDLILVAKWNGYGGSIFSQLRVSFANGHPVSARWLKLGSFMYERPL